MSKALDNADLIRTRLLTAPAEGELPTSVDLTVLEECIIVDRQKDLLTKVNAAQSKAGGTAITILWNGYRVTDRHAPRPKLAHSYAISVYSKPVLAGAALAADEVMQSIIARLWQWSPDGKNRVHGEVEITDGGMIPHPKYLIYDLGISVPTLH